MATKKPARRTVKPTSTAVALRGQAFTHDGYGHHGCRGRLTITLSGPQGCGKSLVSKILQHLLPLTALVEVVIIETQTRG